MLGKRLTQEHIKKALETRQKHGGYPTGEKHHRFGIKQKHTKETINKIKNTWNTPKYKQFARFSD